MPVSGGKWWRVITVMRGGGSCRAYRRFLDRAAQGVGMVDHDTNDVVAPYTGRRHDLVAWKYALGPTMVVLGRAHAARSRARAPQHS